MNPTTSAILQVEDLRKVFSRSFPLGPVEVLKGVSFSVEAGKITGFLGRNGSGKTTSMKSILGLVRPTSGRIFCFGQEGLTTEARTKIGFLPERPYFYDYLTGQEFLDFYARLSGIHSSKERQARAQELLKKVGLQAAGQKPLRTYSKGMLQRIGIAQAVIHRPQFVILDEPMSGLDPDGRKLVMDVILDVAKEGATVLFSSHLLNDAEKICQNIIILDQGKVCLQESLQKVLEASEQGAQILWEDRNGKHEETVSKEQVNPRVREILSVKNQRLISVLPLRASLEDIFQKIVTPGQSGTIQ